jgi:cellulose synthase/poly-beta-1,6-N-acetylglucosamine synthase-like glycosyltransferase
MIFVFWVGVLWLAYVYAGYPLLLGLITLVARIRPILRDDFSPTVSVLISARNEEEDIGWKVRETLAWNYPPDRLEVLVASDASEDRTDDIVRSIEDPRVTLVRMERRGGKARALNRLAELAQGDLLFFTDANSRIGPDCLRRMVRHFADGRVGCVTGYTRSGDGNKGSGPDSGAGVYWGYELLTKCLENQFGSVLVCDGAVFCIRRELFRPLLPDLANDLELPLWVGHQGYWTRLELQAQVAEKDTSSAAEEFSRRRRICAQGALGMWKLRRMLRGVRGWQFVSHKFLRWLTFIPMMLALFSSAALANTNLFTVLFGLQALFYATALAGLLLALRRRSAGRLLSAPFYILITSVGALVGVLEACLGRRFDIWESPALTRGDLAEGR